MNVKSLIKDLLLSLIYFYSIEAQSLNTPITHPSRIYFQKIGNIKLSNSHWNLLTYINISNYNQKQSQIHEIIEQIKTSCVLGNKLDKEYTEHVCSQYNSQVVDFLDEINTNIEYVVGIIQRPPTHDSRSKKGLINIVGHFINVLFGICDDKDAEYFHSEIRELEHSKSKRLQVTDTQTQITQSIITNVNSSLVELEKKRGSLADEYNYLLQAMTAEKMELDTLKYKSALAERIALSNIILAQYAHETENLASIVNNALQGFIHSSLLDTNEFNEQLKEIKLKLPIGSDIPFDLSDSGKSDLLRLVNISIVYIEGVLIFIIEVPLVNNYDFTLYKYIPLPVKMYNNLYAIIEPNFDYIALDNSCLYYTGLSNHQLSKCKTTTDAIICYHVKPVQNVGESCEMMLFQNPESLPNSCNVKYIMSSQNIWHKLNDNNTWLYVADTVNVTITCKHLSTPLRLSLNGTGILTLENNCELNFVDDTIELIPGKNYSLQLNISINYDVLKNENLNYLLFPKENPKIKDKLIKLLENSILLIFHISELKNQTKHTNQEKMNNTSCTNYPYNIISTIIVSSVGLTLILIMYIKMKCYYISKEVEK